MTQTAQDAEHWRWPFFEDAHHAFAAELEAWCRLHSWPAHESDTDAACRRIAIALGGSGWLRQAVVSPHGGSNAALDCRTLCLAREILAFHDPLADFVFAMQGLGSGAISLFGSQDQKARWLPGVARGETIAAFALSESEAGSEITAMRTTLSRGDDGSWRLDGEKTWISNGGIADFYVVFARYPAGGDRSFAAVVLPADAVGLKVEERLRVIAPHPLARISFNNCKLPLESVVGEAGRGLGVALGTLDIFRPTVGAAATGMARRAMKEALDYSGARTVRGQRLADLQLTQARLASMATEIDASALLVYRAAWTRDRGMRPTREAAMAKWYATEAAQRVVDGAVQLFGGRGVQSGNIVERLYREVRALRIYEGTSEIQQLVIASQLSGKPASGDRTR